jgi:hypothetical protein
VRKNLLDRFRNLDDPERLDLLRRHLPIGAPMPKLAFFLSPRPGSANGEAYNLYRQQLWLFLQNIDTDEPHARRPVDDEAFDELALPALRSCGQLYKALVAKRKCEDEQSYIEDAGERQLFARKQLQEIYDKARLALVDDLRAHS